MIAKRIFDFLGAAVGLILLSPLFCGIALWIKFDTPGPVFFRQERVGRHGRLFRIHKFRSMAVDAEKRGLQITVRGDARITASGAFIRKYKLDELPQLIDVLLGDMSLVGPRPEVARYVACYAPSDRALVQSVRPGITDLASLEFRNENDLLVAAADPEATYVSDILPRKMVYYRQYVQTRSLWLDVRIIMRTIRLVFFR